MTNRRHFIKSIPVFCLGVALAPLSLAAGTRLDEKAPNAVALGYRQNAKLVDKTKSPRYKPGQACANCVLFQGKPGAAYGGCPIFGTSQVASAGWCNSYSPKA